MARQKRVVGFYPGDSRRRFAWTRNDTHMDRTMLIQIIILPLLILTADPKPTVVKLGTLSATAPATWKSEKPNNLLRSYQFKLPSGDPAFADAEVAVYKEASPKVEEKFAEWKATFMPPEGMTIDDIAKVSKYEVGTATSHVLDITGTWKYRDRPRDPKSKEELKPDYRAVWVILRDKEETTHIRLSGPMTVVEKHVADFEKWLKSAK